MVLALRIRAWGAIVRRDPEKELWEFAAAVALGAFAAIAMFISCAVTFAP